MKKLCLASQYLLLYLKVLSRGKSFRKFVIDFINLNLMKVSQSVQQSDSRLKRFCIQGLYPHLGEVVFQSQTGYLHRPIVLCNNLSFKCLIQTHHQSK